MAALRNLPLFVLPMTLCPGEVTRLRVFEPRYKQMLDSCLLDERPFGLVLADPFNPVRGWDGPRRVGTLAHIEHHTEVGSNHMIVIRGGDRFEVSDVHEPALPPFEDPVMADLVPEGAVFPSLEVLLERAEDLGRGDLPLYISADVRLLPTPSPEPEHLERLETVLRDALLDLGEALGVEESTSRPWVEARLEELVGEGNEAILLASAMVLPDLETRQRVLASGDCDEMLLELEQGLAEVRAAFGQDQA